MGVQITELLIKHDISLDGLKNKKIAVDAFNVLYQFITTIRQRDGTSLMDSSGNVTSHLNGLFYRTSTMMEKGMKPVFVFDGRSPDLKKKEKERREALKQDAEEKHRVALECHDVEGMRKYAGRTARLTKEMIEESKELIIAMGLPIVQAPSEGEAQAAHMQERGDVDFISSQDTDSLLFGGRSLIRNLSITGKKKKIGTISLVQVSPQLVSLEENLRQLGIDQDQLIALAMLVGTDFNVGGIKGIGPKNAIKVVKEYGHDFDRMFKEKGWDSNFDFSWQDVYDTIRRMPVTEDYNLSWSSPDTDKIKDILCARHDFSSARVESVLKRISDGASKRSQKGLGEFI